MTGSEKAAEVLNYVKPMTCIQSTSKKDPRPYLKLWDQEEVRTKQHEYDQGNKTQTKKRKAGYY